MNPVFELNVERNISTVSAHSEADMVGKVCLSMFFLYWRVGNTLQDRVIDDPKI